MKHRTGHELPEDLKNVRDDSFQLITPDRAIFILCVLVVLAAIGTA